CHREDLPRVLSVFELSLCPQVLFTHSLCAYGPCPEPWSSQWLHLMQEPTQHSQLWSLTPAPSPHIRVPWHRTVPLYRSLSDHDQHYQLCGRADNTLAIRVVCTWGADVSRRGDRDVVLPVTRRVRRSNEPEPSEGPDHKLASCSARCDLDPLLTSSSLLVTTDQRQRSPGHVSQQQLVTSLPSLM
ncbi:unnamed protein product, partial [Boreogadus saida]